MHIRLTKCKHLVLEIVICLVEQLISSYESRSQGLGVIVCGSCLLQSSVTLVPLEQCECKELRGMEEIETDRCVNTERKGGDGEQTRVYKKM